MQISFFNFQTVNLYYVGKNTRKHVKLNLFYAFPFYFRFIYTISLHKYFTKNILKKNGIFKLNIILSMLELGNILTQFDEERAWLMKIKRK